MDRKRILVIDDEPKICELVMAMLELDHHSVETATSGSEALEKFDRGSFQIVFTDFLMPGMAGDAVAKAIKSRAPHVKVILLSACPPSRPPRELDYILMKPFTPLDLRMAIAKVTAEAKAAA
jgi:CheY-like chemotaxis protein